MFRVTANQATADGKYTSGNPLTGTRATVVSATDMNRWQNEIVNAIELAGLTLDENDNTQLLQAINEYLAIGGSSAGIPNGGSTNYFLAKASNSNYDVTWLNPATQSGRVGAGGATNTVLGKASNTNYDVTWIAHGSITGLLPSAGTTNQILAKVDGTDYNVAWTSLSAIGGAPAGGDSGTVLVKNSGTNFDASWSHVGAASNYIVSTLAGSSTASSGSFITPTADVASQGITRVNHVFTVPIGGIYMLVARFQWDESDAARNVAFEWRTTGGTRLSHRSMGNGGLSGYSAAQNQDGTICAVISTIGGAQTVGFYNATTASVSVTSAGMNFQIYQLM